MPTNVFRWDSVKVQAFSRDTTEMDPDNAAVRRALVIKSCSSLIVCSTSQALLSIVVANPCRWGLHGNGTGVPDATWV